MQLTFGQTAYMVAAIARSLEQVGIAATPRAVEYHLAQAAATSEASADTTPLTPAEQFRASLRLGMWAVTPPEGPTADAPPDAWQHAIQQRQREVSR